MPDNNGNNTEIFILLLALIPLILQIFNPTTYESQIIMGIMLIVGLFSVGWNYVKKNINRIDKNSETIKKIDDKINVMERIYEIDKRLSIIEKRKGQVDPQILIIILLLILLFLFLRSAGYI